MLAQDSIPCPCLFSSAMKGEQTYPQRISLQTMQQATSTVYLCSDLLVAVENVALREPWAYRDYDTTRCLWLMFQMAGETHTTIGAQQVDLAPGCVLAMAGAYVERESYSAPGQKIQRVDICLSEGFLHRYFQQDFQRIPRELEQLLGGSDMVSMASKNAISPSLLFPLRQLHQAPFDDSLELLFVESRALDIVCRSLGALAKPRREAGRIGLSQQDIERIYYARELLLKDVTAPPPSIKSLANRAGINDFKLKKGFRRLFGVTIHACHRDARMDYALALMNEGRLNVCEVACAVGYANPSHFSRLFYSRFKIHPGAYLQDLRRKGRYFPLGPPPC